MAQKNTLLVGCIIDYTRLELQRRSIFAIAMAAFAQFVLSFPCYTKNQIFPGISVLIKISQRYSMLRKVLLLLSTSPVQYFDAKCHLLNSDI